VSPGTSVTPRASRGVARRSAAGALSALATLTIGFAAAFAAEPRANGVLPDEAIRRILVERLGADAETVGIVVGIVEPAGRRIVAHGRRGAADPRPIDGDTAFEIGSVTKGLTGLLLADMVRRGEVALEDPVVRHLPTDVVIPQRNGRPITLLDLATHTSGLPFMPDNGPASDRSELYRFLARLAPQDDVPVVWDYSNLGYWLMGEALGSRAGMSYEALLRTRVLVPLGMKDSAVTLSPELDARLAAGHDASLQPAARFATLPTYSLMPSAGGLVSTARDRSAFLAAVLGYERSSLAPAIDLMLASRRPKSRPGSAQSLGWTVEGEGEGELVFHDGGTFGYASAVAWDPTRRVGVVVLSNRLSDVADLARHLLRPEIPLAPPRANRHTEIALDSATLDAYAGRYEVTGEGVFVVAREGEFLTLESPPDWGLPKLRIRPEGRTEFFAAELPLRITFRTDAGGRVTGLLLHPPRGQKAVPAARLAGG
jgi:D-alanyl-D-alanine-carboxypeptidase/D-alanyl-D-alanine-endopeptidase